MVRTCGEKDREEDAVITWKLEVSRHRNIGRPKLRWTDVIRNATKENGVQREEAQSRRTCRIKT